MITITLLLVIAYFIGSINSAIITCKLMRLPDPRSAGSKNPGATNVMRIAGKRAAAIVFIGDALKGIVPIALARMLGIHEFFLGLIGFAAVLGHTLPIFYELQGGKGVATTFGVLLGLSPIVALAAAITWGGVAAISRYVSLASLAAALLSPVYVMLFSHGGYFLPLVGIAAIVVWRHWDNVQRLRAGTEYKITRTKKT